MKTIKEQSQEIRDAQLRYWALAADDLERRKDAEVSAYRRELSSLLRDHGGLSGWFSGRTVPNDKLEGFLKWTMGEWGTRLGLDVAAEASRILEFMPQAAMEEENEG